MLMMPTADLHTVQQPAAVPLAVGYFHDDDDDDLITMMIAISERWAYVRDDCLGHNSAGREMVTHHTYMHLEADLYHI